MSPTRWLVVPALVAALAGCSGKAKTAPLPSEPAQMTVTMTEYHFEHPPEVPAGRVLFRVHNGGSMNHQLTVIALPNDFEGTLDRQLHSEDRMPLPPVALLSVQAPGTDEVFAADLPPGKYGFLCFLEAPEGGNHALRGMSSEFVVR
jgi:hypothetical protein